MASSVVYIFLFHLDLLLMIELLIINAVNLREPSVTVLGSILPSEAAARSPAWQTVRRQLLEPLGPSRCRGIQTAPPISSGGGILGGIWRSLLPTLPDRGNNKSQNTARSVLGG